MKAYSLFRLVGLLGLVVMVAVGCASAPTQEMSDARQAIQAAREAGAQQYAPKALGSAEELLGAAEGAIESRDFDMAREKAVAAKKRAVAARNMALAIGAAQASLDEAQKLGTAWRDTQKILDQAKAAADAGDEEQAVKLAGKAKFQAETAIDQHYLEAARVMLMEAEAARGHMSPDQQALYNDAQSAFRGHDGKTAFDLASRLAASLREAPAEDRYTVERGDHLWGISGKSEIYSDPYRWPMIYKANHEQIRDADLIYPGQDFAIPRAYSDAEVDAAVAHARTRGAWSLGVVEESDRRYLGR